MTKNLQLSRLATLRLITVFIFVSSLLLTNAVPVMVHVPEYAFGQIILQENRHSYSQDISYKSNGGSYSMGLDGYLTIPDYPTIPANQNPIITKNALSGTQIPKNLIIGPSCAQSCPPIIGTQKDDMIYATTVADALIYSLKGDDVVMVGIGDPQVYGGSGDDVLVGGSGNPQLYGGGGDDVLIGGFGSNLLLGGDGNDQLYAGPGHDMLLGGNGADFFDCGSSGNAIIMDFNPMDGDIKAGNCKFVISSDSYGNQHHDTDKKSNNNDGNSSQHNKNSKHNYNDNNDHNEDKDNSNHNDNNKNNSQENRVIVPQDKS